MKAFNFGHKNILKRILIYTIYLTLTISTCFSQSVLSHEREVASPENYNFVDIEFDNEEEGFTLSGTLITPKSKFDKILVIVPGTGKDGRNSHFKLVDSLLQNNVAVYRYDERGVGKSQGKYSNLYLFSNIRKYNDLYYCLNKLREIDEIKEKKIGVLGHSEGGLASIEAYEKGAQIDFFIQWAVPIKPYDTVRFQYEKGSNKGFFKTLKIPSDRHAEFIDLVNTTIQLNKYEKNSKIRKVIDKAAKSSGFNKGDYQEYLSSTLFISLLKKDYEATYKNIESPVFYIIGSMDEIVDPIKNTQILREIKNNNIDICVMPNLYHMLSKEKFSEPGPKVYLIEDEANSKIIQWITKSF
ncbi:hypothetical protein GCM10007049_16490 [Echinicola pacifica]|uniref:Serine aminopeptidase S33 domain-containing protein n=1 Tax=Echinicola pacifica TaxID=346377 RepID=A0A918PXX8_9BACT|nr:alpha/beta hydrolase [Echinicola pacifica]GGZ24789.1 hypothetical protein GCM10007049_16490 [Echinicola pacifica]